MKEEQWIHKIKERLEDYSEPLPASGWERLEKVLPNLKVQKSKQKRILIFRRWAIASAASLLVAISSISLWFLNSPVGEDMKNTQVPVLVSAADELPVQPSTSQVRTTVNKPMLQAKSNFPKATSQQPFPMSHSSAPKETDKTETIDTSEPISVPKQAQSNSNDTLATQEGVKTRPKYPKRNKGKLILPEENSRKNKRKGWAMGISVNSISGGLESTTDNSAFVNDYLNSSGTTYNTLDLLQTSNEAITIPEGKELIFRGGIPYLQSYSKQISSIDHKQPVSVGVSIRKELTKGFSLETGLTYTYLMSEISFIGSSQQYDQKLHYLGIPLRANWNFINKKEFITYISAGGAIEKCIYGTIGSEKETVKPLQFSLMSAVGIQYNVSRKVGIYLEPGISYFFDDGSYIQTIRKERPCSFTLQAGFRLTY